MKSADTSRSTFWPWFIWVKVWYTSLYLPVTLLDVPSPYCVLHLSYTLTPPVSSWAGVTEVKSQKNSFWRCSLVASISESQGEVIGRYHRKNLFLECQAQKQTTTSLITILLIAMCVWPLAGEKGDRREECTCKTQMENYKNSFLQFYNKITPCIPRLASRARFKYFKTFRPRRFLMLSAIRGK